MVDIFTFITPANLDAKIKLVQLYGWLLSGIVTALLIAWLNTWKEKRYYRNLASIVTYELDLNHTLLQCFESGAEINTSLFTTSAWHQSKYDLAKHLPPIQFQCILNCYRRLDVWKERPHTVILEEIALCRFLIKQSLDYLAKTSKAILPDN